MTDNNDELGIIDDAARIAGAVWTRIDHDNLDANRDFQDEFASRIATAAYTDSVASFVDRLTDKAGVRSLDDSDILDIVKQYDGDDRSRAFLKTARNNSALVVLQMKEHMGELN